ncbi:Type III secretion apparatus protein PrgH/EprH [Paraburkholderia ribeironis]|uniref:Type III secretion apparatus protein PrgH/EprH n=1 Tax=Paraburkholderia ribeironis TaxID=1247936 RepID=A0A1N7SC99_9BURK|nr:PrgH/EprH family type III secretion apparatus protein [Paraburkholderia ribeironis]SIT44993.1 Type III secretion apparatus protein PrgH/EprH [Paraburkholderia ribeironis]
MSEIDYYDQAYHLRILFGPLFGTDIELPCDEVFFCVGGDVGDSKNEAISHSLHRATNTLYIPYRSGAPNFRLRITSRRNRTIKPNNEVDCQNDNADFSVDFVSPDGGKALRHKFNRICRHGDIHFAVKPACDAWSDEINNFTDQPESLRYHHRANAGKGKWFSRFKIGAVLIAGAAAMAAVCWQVNEYLNTHRLARASRLLADAPTRNDVLAGRDGRIYVVSATLDGLDWDRQAVRKAVPSEPIRIVSAPGERLRLEHALDAQGVDFVTVRMDEPQCPVLLLDGNISQAARDEAVGILKKTAPYVQQVQLQYPSVGAIETDARNELQKAGVHYRQLGRPRGSTFEVAGAINDGELAALQNLISSFNGRWGTRRVDFKIAMRTDWLNGKTYREGDEGYVLVNHASWYFPQHLDGGRR